MEKKINANSNPLVSIILPAFNHEQYVQQTIRSLIDQDYKNLELIVLNDGSTDRTSERIKEMAPECLDRFARFEFVDKKNEGLSRTLNQAVKLARGKFIFHIASDDWVVPSAISTLMKVVEGDDQTIALVCGDASFIDSEGNPIELKKQGRSFTSLVRSNTFDKRDFILEKDFGSYRSLLLSNYIPIGLLVRTSIYEKLGPYVEGAMLEDIDLWLRVAKKYKMVFVDKVLARYRIHSTNTVSLHKESLLIDYANILNREFGYCLENKLIKEWRFVMYNILLQFLKKRRFNLLIKYLPSLGYLNFLLLSLNRLAGWPIKRLSTK